MIVKNEENNLRQALSWGREAMWEQIVVDTGSTDRTVEIAKEMGAKVFHFTWIDDFSAAKNYAIDQAGGDWIAFLDADEHLDEKAAKNLPGLLLELDSSPFLALVSQWINLDANGYYFYGGNQIRFFRNRADIRYKGRVHEALKKNGKSLEPDDLINVGEELALYHTGYAKPRAESGKKKGELYLRLILKELDENPDDYRMMGYLGDIYDFRGEQGPAAEWYEKAVMAMPSADSGWLKYDSRTSATFGGLLSFLCADAQVSPEKIMEIYEKAASYLPGESDFDYIVGQYFASRHEYGKAILHLEKALDLLEKNGTFCYAAILAPNLAKARETLAISCYHEGNWEKCVKYCIAFLIENRFHMGILKMLLGILSSDFAAAGSADENCGQLMDFLDKLYDFSSPKDRLFVFKAAKELGNARLTQALSTLFSPEELQFLNVGNFI